MVKNTWQRKINYIVRLGESIQQSVDYTLVFINFNHNLLQVDVDNLHHASRVTISIITSGIVRLKCYVSVT